MSNAKDFVQSLGIKDMVAPCSTGLNWFGSTADHYESYSPVDGKKIGSVGKATLEDYEKVVKTAEAAKAE